MTSRVFYSVKEIPVHLREYFEGIPEKANRVNAPRSSEGENFSPSQNHHPTVKPQQLMRHLVRLCTPANGIVLDPFAGSGSTGVACVYEGVHYICVEKEQEYVDIARARIAHAHAQVQGKTQAQASLWQTAQEQAQESETESEVA